MSTVFGSQTKKRISYNYDEDEEPVLMHLRFLDYRYVRFFFNPKKDRFVLCSEWKDPGWTGVKSMRAGLETEERHRREKIFDKNEIDIEENPISQLLIDEVSIVAAAG